MFEQIDTAHIFTPWKQHGILAGFSTRNLEGIAIADDVTSILAGQNLSAHGIIFMHQIHGAMIHCITSPAFTPLEGDGLTTNVPGICLVVKTADCVPVFLCDPMKKTICVIHAGWRSAHAGIVAHGLHLMSVEYGSKVKDIQMMIGPCLRKECFEVQNDFLTNTPFMPFIAHWPDGRMHFDLVGFIIQEARTCGIASEAITDTGLCSVCRNDRFYSYRTEKRKDRRTLSFMMLT